MWISLRAVGRGWTLGDDPSGCVVAIAGEERMWPPWKWVESAVGARRCEAVLSRGQCASASAVSSAVAAAAGRVGWTPVAVWWRASVGSAVGMGMGMRIRMRMRMWMGTVFAAIGSARCLRAWERIWRCRCKGIEATLATANWYWVPGPARGALDLCCLFHQLEGGAGSGWGLSLTTSHCERESECECDCWRWGSWSQAPSASGLVAPALTSFVPW